MRLVLCQLYPEHLSIYADRGNVMILRKRCAWRGIELVESPLLGHVYRGHLGDDMRGLGLLDLETNAGTTRMIGNVLLESDLGDGPRTIVGFENHAGRTTLAPGLAPLGRVLSGNGNDGESGYEGARAGRVLGTYVHGPLLPKNAWLADWLIREALDRRYGAVELEPLDDGLEERAHAAAARIR